MRFFGWAGSLVYIGILFPVVFTLVSFEEKGDAVSKYIAGETANMDELLRNGEFVPGFIFTPLDTMQTQIFVFKGRKKKNAFLFFVSRFHGDSIRVLTAENVCAYSVGNKYFVSHASDGDAFFIQLKKEGRACLYERDGIPGDRRSLYYLLLPGQCNYFVFDTEQQNISSIEIQKGQKGERATVFTSKNTGERFALFVNQFLGDCPALRNMVQAGFLTMNDLPQVIETYNRCFE